MWYSKNPTLRVFVLERMERKQSDPAQSGIINDMTHKLESCLRVLFFLLTAVECVQENSNGLERRMRRIASWS